ncbi:MAG TPA: hypothetical protein VF194_13220 [Ferrovibrio sp.]
MTMPLTVFWSGETLQDRLKDLIAPFSPDRVDCAAYTLAIGPEMYVSPNDQAADPTTVTVRRLGEGEGFAIPPGQFAFLLTEEVVSVPANALAFISIRAKTKFRGLVNVSGFHVDPGYRGQLTFAVFNAGPVPVHLKRGQAIFLIWYANLDCETTFKKDGVLHTGIDPEIINAVSGELQSVGTNLADQLHNTVRRARAPKIRVPCDRFKAARVIRQQAPEEVFDYSTLRTAAPARPRHSEPGKRDGYWDRDVVAVGVLEKDARFVLDEVAGMDAMQIGLQDHFGRRKRAICSSMSTIGRDGGRRSRSVRIMCSSVISPTSSTFRIANRVPTRGSAFPFSMSEIVAWRTPTRRARSA